MIVTNLLSLVLSVVDVVEDDTAALAVEDSTEVKHRLLARFVVVAGTKVIELLAAKLLMEATLELSVIASSIMPMSIYGR